MSDTVSRERSFSEMINIPALLAGILLLALLPVGHFEAVSSALFARLFVGHLVFLGLALFASLAFFLNLLRFTGLAGLLAFFVFIVLLAALYLLGSVPVVARDALIHHLAVPKWWVLQDQIAAVSWHEWSFYPMLINLAYTALIKFNLEQYAAYYHGIYLILLSAVIAAFVLRQTQSHAISLCAYLITFSTPVVLRLASSPLVDLGLALYCTIAVFYLVKWSSKQSAFWCLVAAGVAFGLAMGCKYNALLFTFLSFSLAVILAKREGLSSGRIFWALSLCATIAFIIFLPWALKNLIWTHNPLYPLFKNVFGASESAYQAASLSPIQKLLVYYGQDWIDILLMPFKMIFLGEDNNPRLYDGVLSPVLVLSILPIFLKFKKSWVLYFSLLIIFYFYLAICFSSARIRYMLPLIGPVIVLLSCAMELIAAHIRESYRKYFFIAITLIHLYFSFTYLFALLKSTKAVPYVFGELSKREYLLQSMDEYRLTEYVNQNLPDNSYVYLLLTGNRFYYYDKRVISGGYFSANKLIEWLKISGSAEFLAKELKSRGIGYILAHTERTQETLKSLLNEEETIIWNRFQSNYMKPLQAANGYSLWQILEAAAKEEQDNEVTEEEPTDNGEIVIHK